MNSPKTPSGSHRLFTARKRSRYSRLLLRPRRTPLPSPRVGGSSATPLKKTPDVTSLPSPSTSAHPEPRTACRYSRKIESTLRWLVASIGNVNVFLLFVRMRGRGKGKAMVSNRCDQRERQDKEGICPQRNLQPRPDVPGMSGRNERWRLGGSWVPSEMERRVSRIGTAGEEFLVQFDHPREQVDIEGTKADGASHALS